MEKYHSNINITHHESFVVDFGQIPSAQHFGGHHPNMMAPKHEKQDIIVSTHAIYTLN